MRKSQFGKRLDQIEFNPEQQKIVDDHIQELGYDVVQYWKDSRAYDADARRALARGGLRDAQSVFKFLENMGENIWYSDHNDNRPYFEKQQKSNFEEILDKTGIKWQSHERAQPGVFALFQDIKNPIDVDKPFPPELLAALKQKAGRVRDKYDSSQTQWTRDYPLRDWIESIENGNEYWTTQIPSKAIEIIKAHGYDGIKELGNKGVDDRNLRQVNWISFEPNQIKSAIGNTGEFSKDNDSILHNKALSTPEAKSLIRDLESHAEAFSKLETTESRAEFIKERIKGAEIKVVGNEILANPDAAELLRQAHAIAFDKDAAAYSIIGEKKGEINLKNLYNKDGDFDYEQVKDVAARVGSGEYQIERLDSGGEQGRIRGGQRNVEASLILAAGESAIQKTSAAGKPRVDSHSDTVKRQESLLESYAKKEGIWFNQRQFPDRLYLGRGGEAFVYQKDENRVVKLASSN